MEQDGIFPKSNRRTVIAGAAAVAAAGVVMTNASRAAAQDATAEATAASTLPMVPAEFEVETNWPVENLDMSNTRNVKGSSIDSSNVTSLTEAWSVPITAEGAYGNLTGNPAVVGDVVYVQDAMSNVYAFNKTTGEQIWYKEYNEAVPSGGPNGIGIGYGRLFTTLGGPGIVLALDLATGDEQWRTTILGPRREGITIAPGVNSGMVYVSTIPGAVDGFYQGGMRGIIHALNAETGVVEWYFDTTTDNLWGNARVNSGGGLWHPPAFDEEGNVYVGIANAAPFPGNEEFPAGTSRPGDNDYANALMRIDPTTASYDWYINVKPFDLFDHDNHLSPILAKVDVDGTETPMVFSSGKHGFVVAANSETGEELWRTPVGEHNENEFLTELGPEEIELLPGILGGTETPMAYADGVVFAPAINLPFTVTNTSLATDNIFAGTSNIVALNAATGEAIWDAAIPALSLAGVTIINDLAFTGSVDGLVRIYNVADGSLVHSIQLAAGINTSIAVSGDYVYVAAGAPLIPSEDSGDSIPEFQQTVYAFTLA